MVAFLLSGLARVFELRREALPAFSESPSREAHCSSAMTAPSVGSASAGQPPERKNKLLTEAQRRSQRPLAMVDHLMDSSSTWARD
eukprot:3822171-Pyramimonas_sp.AAC.1